MPSTIPKMVSAELPAAPEGSGKESSSTVDCSPTLRAPAEADGKLGKRPRDFLCAFVIGRAVEDEDVSPFLLLEGGKNIGTGFPFSATGAGLVISFTLNTLLRTLGVGEDAVVVWGVVLPRIVWGVVLPRAFTRSLLRNVVLPFDFEFRFLKLCVRWFTGVAGPFTCDEGVVKVFPARPLSPSFAQR